MVIQNKINAINKVLIAIGDQPITEEDYNIAQIGTPIYIIDGILDLKKQEINSRGWWYNTDEVILTPNTDGIIEVSPNVLGIDSRGQEEHRKLIIRNNVLFDRETYTTKFTEPLQVKLIFNTDWADLPLSIYEYIILLSTIEAQGKLIGSSELHQIFIQQLPFIEDRIQRDEIEYQTNNLLNQDLRR